MTKNIFRVICKKCQGKCCRATVLLVQKDVNQLNRKYKGRFKVINEETGYEETPGHMAHNEKHMCPFLEEQRGCVLEEEYKPFDCRFFPLAFIYKNNNLSFYLNKKCSYYMYIPKSWIIQTKKWAEEQLKSWTEKEKLAYSKDVESYPSSQLIPI